MPTTASVEQERQASGWAPAAHGLCLPLDSRDASTVARVRAVIRDVCAVLGVMAEAVDGAEQGVAELAGNAIRHAREPVELRLRVDDDAVVIAIVDGEERLPVWPPVAAPEALLDADTDLDEIVGGLSTGGRGLGLVRLYSGGRCGAHAAHTRWGTPGKAVWFAQTRQAHSLP